MHRAFVFLLLLLPACFCNDDLRAAVVGDIIDSDGNPIVPDRVTLTADSYEEECTWDDTGHYSCLERGGGLYLLRVTVGDVGHEREIQVDYDGCHDETRHVDVVVD